MTAPLPPTAALIAAAGDADLRARIQAAASARGLPLNWTDLNIGQLVATSIPNSDEQTTIAAVYSYAASTYQPAPRPGENPAAVLDPMIHAAIDTIREA